LVVNLVLISLLWSIIHDRTTYLKQILGDVLTGSGEATALGVNVQSFPVLVDHRIQLDGLSSETFLTDEMKLVQNIDEIYLVGCLDLVLDDHTEFTVELLDQLRV
jgi:hypothetical protein